MGVNIPDQTGLMNSKEATTQSKNIIHNFFDHSKTNWKHNVTNAQRLMLFQTPRVERVSSRLSLSFFSPSWLYEINRTLISSQFKVKFRFSRDRRVGPDFVISNNWTIRSRYRMPGHSEKYPSLFIISNIPNNNLGWFVKLIRFKIRMNYIKTMKFLISSGHDNFNSYCYISTVNKMFHKNIIPILVIYYLPWGI